MPDPTASLYDQDFYAWANEQAALLRAGKLSAADIEHIAEEIESMGRSEMRELISRLSVLFMHLLKWQCQPAGRCNSWRFTITEQRNQLARHLRYNPSLKSRLAEAVQDAYPDAILSAARETNLDLSAFPAVCPWNFDQIMDADFWPGEATH
jgi:hypothetical protein